MRIHLTIERDTQIKIYYYLFVTRDFNFEGLPLIESIVLLTIRNQIVH